MVGLRTHAHTRVYILTLVSLAWKSSKLWKFSGLNIGVHTFKSIPENLK